MPHINNDNFYQDMVYYVIYINTVSVIHVTVFTSVINNQNFPHMTEYQFHFISLI